MKKATVEKRLLLISYIRFFTMLNIVIPSTSNCIALKAFSTVFLLHFLLRPAPINPPRIAPKIISGAIDKSKSLKPDVSAIVVSFEICANKIVISEQIVAVFVVTENK